MAKNHSRRGAGTDEPAGGACGLRETLRLASIQGIVLVACATLVALVFNAYRPGGLELWGVPGLQAPDGFETITLEEAFAGYEEENIVFVDARESPAFNSGHLPGALSIPAAEASLHADRLMQTLSSGKVAVIYCDSPGCPLSERLASALSARGICDMRILEEGWEGWYLAGYPIEEGPGS
ncbi:MAG: rhodanese-like domain-containing protein [Desulfomonilia bacterium]